MRCFIGIDLGSTTTKAVVMDEGGDVLGRRVGPHGGCTQAAQCRVDGFDHANECGTTGRENCKYYQQYR